MKLSIMFTNGAQVVICLKEEGSYIIDPVHRLFTITDSNDKRTYLPFEHICYLREVDA